MKRVQFLFTLFLMVSISTFAQTAYQFSFKLQKAGNSVPCKALFITNGDGTGMARIRFNTTTANDSTLIDMKVTEEITDEIPGCAGKGRLYFKLEKNQLIFGSDSNFILPQYFCFKLDVITGLYEPMGYSNSIDDCKAAVTTFSEISFLEQKDLTSDFVLTYFKPREKFYTNLFSKTRALTVNEQNVKMYLLVVANTFDDSIGKACAKDLKRTMKFFKDIQEFLGIKFEYDTIAGKNYNKQKVEKAIEKLGNAGPNDIIVFYYSGHGFRVKTGDTRLPPYIDLRPNYDGNPDNLNSMSMADIFQIISGMRARFKLVVGDCCNSFSNTYSIKAPAPPRTKGFSFTGSIQNGADLFLNATRSSVLLYGASPGEYSVCNDDFGGFFSHNLFTGIENQLKFYNSNATWQKIIDYTKANTIKMSKRVECPLPANPKNRCFQSPGGTIE